MVTSLVASKTNSLDPDLEIAKARLVLAVGSQSGRVAPLQAGYYMIGRHQECQVRPKSRSVSRRHCLLYQDDAGLQVLDLGSTSGTRVNDLRLRPKTWTVLRHGDMLRCGKVAFRVELGVAVSQVSASSHSSSCGSSDSESLTVGKAWHDVDIAGFLETEDDADRAQRYQKLRSANESTNTEDSVDDMQTTIEMDVDLDLFEDDFGDGASPRATDDRRKTNSSPERKTRAAGSNASDKRGKGAGFSKSATMKSSRQSSFPKFSLGSAANADRWKTVGMTMLMLVTLSLLSYSAYRFYSGPNVRVLQSID